MGLDQEEINDIVAKKTGNPRGDFGVLVRDDKSLRQDRALRSRAGGGKRP